MSPRTPQREVVVVTGASSGLGLATAERMAGRGANVVLVAREQNALDEAGEACRSSGAEVLTFAADVSDQASLGRVRGETLERFGRIDVWVNDAGTAAWGPALDAELDDLESVVRTNLFGTMVGSQLALQVFRRQRAGVLINIASMLALLPIPFGSAYVASKHAVRGFTLSLRQEVTDLPEVHVCLVEPGSIDTPLFVHARNTSGHQLRPNPPTYQADRVARTVVRLVDHPRAEVQPGVLMWLAARMHRLAPGPFDATLGWAVRRAVSALPEQPPTADNLDAPIAPHALSGGWKD